MEYKEQTKTNAVKFGIENFAGYLMIAKIFRMLHDKIGIGIGIGISIMLRVNKQVKNSTTQHISIFASFSILRSMP